MEHNLEDPLTMESIENMDFEHSGVEVTQEEMCLEDNGQTDSMTIGMDIVQEQPTIIEGSTEEVIVSDFMGEQFGFQEYSVQSENTSGANITIDASQLSELTTQNEQIIDMQYIEQPKASSSQAGLITIKPIQQRPVAKKATATAPVPRQVAIAPKPTKGVPNVQYAIAPKPVTLMVNKGATGPKTVSMKSVMQNLKGNTVLTQIGKQLVIMPAGQKLKLSSVLPGTSADGSNIQIVRDSAQLVGNKGGKQMKTKFIIQGQSSSEPAYQPAVLTKIAPVTSAAPTLARYIMQQKTVPISIGGNKVILTSPSKQTTAVKVAPKKQIISIKTETPKTTTSQANIQTKKIVITANPSSSQLKTTAVKTTTTQSVGQRTQLHPINVPGKGIQYIKLVTNQPAAQKTAAKPQTVTVGGKNFVLTDNKGNIFQMGGERVLSSQPPPLIVASNALANVSGKGRKLVRIAPISSKSEASAQSQSSKILQSLLVPREQQPAVLPGTSMSLEEYNQMVGEQGDPGLLLSDGSMLQEETVTEEQEEMDTEVENLDVKPTLASLVSDAVGEPEPQPESEPEPEHEPPSLEVRYRARKQEYLTEDESTLDNEVEVAAGADSMIILPHDVHEQEYQDDSNASMTEAKMSTSLAVEHDTMEYLTPDVDKSYADAVLLYENNSAMRPRKACNCTKSQCLKLYCDCFANGEFCNQCNCNNCHNNLHHEDTRQKAIRACLERNPNAFRPKIGKAKAGGPEIVRRHNKGCNCKRSGCLKNYCECYEAKIACTLMCKCVGCRNIEETIERRRDAIRMRERLADPAYRQPLPMGQVKQPCSFLTREVIEAVAQCMLATVTEDKAADADPVDDILVEFSRCMADIISASHQAI